MGRASWIGAIVWVVLVVSFALRGVNTIHEGGGDFQGYAEVGELVLTGHDPYSAEAIGLYIMPPLFSVLAVPLALGTRAAPYLTMAAWLTAMAACLFGCIYLAIWLVYGRPLSLRGRPGAISLTSAAALVPALLTWRYVLQNARWLQSNFLVLLLVLAGCYLLARHRAERGGAMVGAGVALKVMPVLFVPYFALKRWWRVAIWAVASAAVVSAASLFVLAPGELWTYARNWMGRTKSIPTPVDWGSHSLFAMVDRYVGHGVLVNRELLSVDVAPTASGDPAVTVVVIGLVAALVLLFIASAWKGGRDPASAEVTVEFAMVLVLIPLVSPSKSWTHYFVFMLLAHVVLWRAASSRAAWNREDEGLTVRQRSTVRWLLGLSVLLGLLVSASITGSAIARSLQMLSLLTFSALVAFLALAYLRWIMGRRTVWSDSEPEAYQSFSTTGSR